MMIKGDDDMSEKKLRGSGGHVFAKVTYDEQKKANLGGPDLFLAGLGRLKDDRFSKYYCNKCEKEFQGSPLINYEKPNEDLGEGVTLMEKGEYRCGSCNNIIAQYRKFNSPNEQTSLEQDSGATDDSNRKDSYPLGSMAKIDAAQPTRPRAESGATTGANTATAKWPGFIPIQSLVGMTAYDNEAMRVGTVQEVGLRKSSRGDTEISVRISKNGDNQTEVLWRNISKIGDILLLGERMHSGFNTSTQCASCGYQNEDGALFCEECGKKLS